MSGFLGKEIDLRDFDHDLYYKELEKRIATSKRKTTVNDSVAGNMGDSFR